MDEKIPGHTLADRVRSGNASRQECESYVSAVEAELTMYRDRERAAGRNRRRAMAEIRRLGQEIEAE